MEDIFSLAKEFHGRQAAELKDQVSEWQVPKRLIWRQRNHSNGASLQHKKVFVDGEKRSTTAW